VTESRVGTEALAEMVEQVSFSSYFRGVGQKKIAGLSCTEARISVLAHLDRVQPFPHGGINE
jgi:hypothetical protein